MNRGFAALRVFGTTLKVFAWISLILGLILAIVALVLGFLLPAPLAIPWLHQSGELVGVLSFLVLLVLAAVSFLLHYAASELVFVLLSIEDNTRRTAYVLQQQYLAASGLHPELPRMPAETHDQELPDQMPEPI